MVISTALGAAALIDPAKLTPGKRALYRSGLAGVTAAMVASDAATGLDRRGRGAAAVAAGGAVLGLSEVGETVDARLQRALVRRGVSKPRLVFATATFALSLMAELPSVVAARRARSAAAPGSRRGFDGAGGSSGTPAELPAGARSLIAGMLDFSADPSATALRTQLDSAQELVWGGVSGSYDVITIAVGDAAALSRAVPHEQQFPVTASFVDSATGQRRLVRMRVAGGMLAELTIENPEDSEAPGDPFPQTAGNWPSRWPALAEVTFQLDSDAPTDPRAAKRSRAQLRG